MRSNLKINLKQSHAQISEHLKTFQAKLKPENPEKMRAVGVHLEFPGSYKKCVFSIRYVLLR